MVLQKFKLIEYEMNQQYFERRSEIRGLLVALISRQHILFLGPPGTGKSDMAENLCRRIDGGQYFRWLLSRTTAPEELFGPVSLKALENDSYRRVTTGKLPEATVAFLDEIWKCNSAVLNSLLTIANERLFFNDGQPVQCPLEIIVGASNELPEDREELGALWDRFTLRYVVNYIRDDREFERMLTFTTPLGLYPATTISMKELKTAQAEAEKVDIQKVIPQIIILRRKMQELNIPVSDRRWKQLLKVIQANAWLEGRQQAQDDDLEILVHALWQDPGQIVQVRHTIMSLVNPLGQEAQDLLDQATEIYNKAMATTENDEDGAKAAAKGTEAIGKLKRIINRLEKLEEEAKKTGKNTDRITEAIAKVKTWNKEVAKKCLGI